MDLPFLLLEVPAPALTPQASVFLGWLRGGFLLVSLRNGGASRAANDLRNAALLARRERYKRFVLLLRKANAELDCWRPQWDTGGCICHTRHCDGWQTVCERQKSAVATMGKYVISYKFESGRFLSVYFEHDGWSDADFMQALRDGAHEDIVRAQTAPLERLRAVAAVDVAGWQIGREIEYVYGAWKLKPKLNVWRRIGESEWCSDGERGNRPTRKQLRDGTIEPYLDDISALMDDLGVTWATQTAPWSLGKLQSARGNKRTFDSAGLVRQPLELDDGYVAKRLGVERASVAKRRMRDKKLALPNSPADSSLDLPGDDGVERKASSGSPSAS